MDWKLGGVILATVAGCATTDYSPDVQSAAAAYEARVIGLRPPTDAEDHAEICRFLRTECAKFQSGMDGQYSDNRATMAQTIAVIESRMAEFGCDAPYRP